MKPPLNPDAVAKLAATYQIIASALIFGVAAFLLIVLFLIPGPSAPPGAVAEAPPADAAAPAAATSTPGLFTLLAIVLGVSSLVLSVVLPRQNTETQRRRLANSDGSETSAITEQAEAAGFSGETAALAGIYQTQFILGAAQLEGAAFFAVIAFMLERDPIALAVVLVMLAALAARFPTTQKISGWLNHQLETLERERRATV
jgi:hypothetical protein